MSAEMSRGGHEPQRPPRRSEERVLISPRIVEESITASPYTGDSARKDDVLQKEVIDTGADTLAEKDLPTTSHERFVFRPGTYTVDIQTDGTTIWQPEGTVQPNAIRESAEPVNIIHPVRVVDEEHGIFSISTPTGTEREFVPDNPMKGDVLKHLIQKPNEWIPREDIKPLMGNHSSGRYLSGLAQQVNRLTGTDTIAVHYSGEYNAGTIVGMTYHPLREREKPDAKGEAAVPIPPETEAKTTQLKAIEKIGDPDLHVYVTNPDTPDKKAHIVSLEPQRKVLDHVLARPDEVVGLDDLEQVIGKGPRRYLDGLMQRFNGRDREVLSKVTDADGEVLGYKFNSGVEASDNPASSSATVEQKAQESHPDIDAIMNQLGTKRPEPGSDIKSRLAWSAAMANLERARDLGVFDPEQADPGKTLDWTQDHSKVQEGVEKIYTLIESGELPHGADLRASDLEHYGINVSPPLQPSIIGRLHALGFVSAPGKAVGSIVNAQFIKLPDRNA
jgi:hypothetical protein